MSEMSGVTSSEGTPLVTVAIPVFNEERHIAACLDSLLATDYPLSSLEVLVIDGGSVDSSVRLVNGYSSRFPLLRIINNPEKIQSAALNIALEQARGEFFVRLDGHSVYQANYITTCVNALISGKADNFGGVQLPVGNSIIQRINAAALRSPFAMGPSAHRHSTHPRYSESVYLGSWKTETLRGLGGFDSTMPVAEDYELNIRLRAAGGRVMVDPALQCRYQARSSLRSLARQYFRFGLWRTRVLRRYPGSFRPRQSAPGLLLLGLLGSAVVAGFIWQVALIVPLLYVLVLLVAVMDIVRREGSLLGLGGLIALPVIHFSYGVGFLWGAVSRSRAPFSAA